MASAVGLADVLADTVASTIVVDLAGLSFLDSSGISALVVARRAILAEGPDRQFVVTRPTEIVRKALEVVGLSKWIVEWLPDWGE